VPERVEKLIIDWQSYMNDFKASVVFESDSRRAENIKYKPKAGQIESRNWSSNAIFPNFKTVAKPTFRC
jgi:hypothetical protein